MSDIQEKLNILYNKIPNTIGCKDNISKADGCGAWCCQKQNPHVLNCEFNNTFNFVMNNDNKDEIVLFFKKALESYFSEDIVKGCIFWNSSTKLCSIHNHRPFNCRIYGITPEEQIKPRIEKLRVFYQDKDGNLFKDQCNLVKTEDGSTVTVKNVDEWWEELKSIEKSLGIPDSDIHDNQGGSYRTFYEYFILSVCDEVTQEKIGQLKREKNKEKINQLIDLLVNGFNKAIKK
jgi:Fe-S-cluster containining protein